MGQTFFDGIGQECRDFRTARGRGRRRKPRRPRPHGFPGSRANPRASSTAIRTPARWFGRWNGGTDIRRFRILRKHPGGCRHFPPSEVRPAEGTAAPALKLSLPMSPSRADEHLVRPLRRDAPRSPRWLTTASTISKIIPWPKLMARSTPRSEKGDAEQASSRRTSRGRRRHSGPRARAWPSVAFDDGASEALSPACWS